MNRLMVIGLLAAMPSAAFGRRVQDTVIVVDRGARLDATSRVAREAVDFFNNRASVRIVGSYRVSADEIVIGDVAVLDGPVRISGTVRGDLVVINGSLNLTGSAEIRGSILVVGGSATGLNRARIDGNARIYRSGVRIRRVRDDELELLRDRPAVRSTNIRNRRRFSNADASIVLSTPGTYNRVEGLPVHVGPRVEWRSFARPRLAIEALAILRTAGGLDSVTDDIGYTAGVEWNIGDGSPVTLGGRIYDHVVAIEDWQLSDPEIGLATLLWHRDYRDYFRRKGYGGFLLLEPTDGLTLSGSLFRDEESSVSARNPWTPFQRQGVWRPNPNIDEGTFTRVTAGIEWDSRPYRDSPSSGWFATVEWERGWSDDVNLVSLPITVRDPGPFAPLYMYDRVFVDLRRYERVGWNGQVGLRAAGAGTIGSNDPLPIQRRLSVGGPDLLPGFDFRRFACNQGVFDPSRPALCDRVVVFQAEYRGNLSFRTPRRSSRGSRRGDDHPPWSDWDFDDWFWFDGPTFVLFGNAASAWIGNDAPSDFEGDVGAGLEIGSLGIYAAKALTEDLPVRVTLRIKRRF